LKRPDRLLFHGVALMSSSLNSRTDKERRILRGKSTDIQSDVLGLVQLEPAAPGDPASVDPRLRDRSIEEGKRIGFERGYQDGLDEARAQVQQQLDGLHNAISVLQQAAEEFRNREIDVLAAAEDETLDAVFALAYAVLQHEISLQESPGLEAIKRALAFAPNGDIAVARLNPADAEQIANKEIEAGGRTIRIVADPTIDKGGCIFEIGPSRIDTQIIAALERMREVL
jgi:flagellar assembly protein FliH